MVAEWTGNSMGRNNLTKMSQMSVTMGGINDKKHRKSGVNAYGDWGHTACGDQALVAALGPGSAGTLAP
jgi:hypothetical protein